MLSFHERYYLLEKKAVFSSVEKHPLQKKFFDSSKKGKISDIKSSKSNISIKKDEFIDPLDPLSRASRIPMTVIEDKRSFSLSEGLNIEPWSSKRLTILTTYTTSEKLSIISSFLSAKPNDQVKIISKSTNISDKVKNRLEQLDQFDEEIRETSNLNVQQFTDKINELQNALKSSWSDGQRVKTLQIVIQTTKMLSDANVAQFFPSKFVLVTDLVDNFANLVYDRLKAKSVITQRNSKLPIELPENFRENQVPEVAKETARNWFYKIASIRELVARLYVEAALLPCYKFFDAAAIGPALMRLMKMSRGIGDPLLATYARAYVSRIGILLEPYRKDYLKLAFDDILSDFQRLKTTPNLTKEYSNTGATNLPYLRLYMPAVDWLLQCLCASASHQELDQLMSRIETVSNNPLLIHAALCSLDSTYIEKKALYFSNLINNLNQSVSTNSSVASATYPIYILYRQLGICVSMARPDSTIKCKSYSDEATELFKIVWKPISALTEPRHFIECADAWAEFVASHFQYLHIIRFLHQIVKHVQRRNDNFISGNGEGNNDGFTMDYYYNQLQSILNKLLTNDCDYESLFSSNEFIQYLALFDKEHLIIDVRQTVLNAFFNSPRSDRIHDPVIVQACIRMLKEMYDSLNSLSVVDHRRIVNKLALTLLNRIRFDDRLVEQELGLLTQFRASFGGLESVIINVIERVNALAMRVRSLRPEQVHNSGSASFVKACMAFSYITAASVGNGEMVIKLYTSIAQTALVNECLGQAEACIKEAIHLLSKLDNPITTNVSGVNQDNKSITLSPLLVSEMASNIASTLLMCPDITSIVMNDSNSSESLGNSALYLLKGLINAINLCPILKTDNQIPTNKSQTKGELYIKILLLLSALSQTDYIYHAGRTDANDRIYGGSEQLIQTISDLFSVVVGKIRALNCTKVTQDLQNILVNILNYKNIEAEYDSLKHDWLIELINRA